MLRPISSNYQGKSVTETVTIQGKPVSDWIQDVLETPEGNHIVEEMQRKYRLAIS